MSEDYKKWSYEELNERDNELEQLIKKKEKSNLLFDIINILSVLVLLFFLITLLNTLRLIEFIVLSAALFFIIREIYLEREIKKLKSEHNAIYLALSVKQEKIRRVEAKKMFNEITAKAEQLKAKQTKTNKSKNNNNAWF
jgi:hypothetical protein